MQKLWVRATLCFILATSIAVAYRLSPLSKRTVGLRVRLNADTPYPDQPNVTRFRAVLTNTGFLPIVVCECEAVSDAVEDTTILEDGIQRWDPAHGTWVALADRGKCRIIPTGSIEPHFSSRLLWPRQRLYTAPFYPYAPPFRSGDELRFVIFPRGEENGSRPIL